MNDLRNSILFLFVFVFAIFGIGNMDFVEQNLINFEPILFILVALTVLSAFIVVPLTHFSIYQFLFIWAAVFIIVRVIYWQVTMEHSSQLIILEFLLMEIGTGLAYDIGRQMRHVTRLLDELTAITYPNRTLDLHTAGDRISAELTRSRRYDRPLSLLVVQIDKLYAQQSFGKDDALQQDILTRFAVARIGQIINDRARETDLILRDTNSRFILICPETEYLNSTKLAERISKSMFEAIGAQVQWGAASFPDEALIFDELVQKAMERLDALAMEQAPVNAENKTIL
jgi:GGDEF domain-containing protein